MTQYGLPTSDISKGSGPNIGQCSGHGDNNANAFEELDEGFGAGRGTGSGPDDITTSWYFGDNGNATDAEILVGINTLTDPGVSTGHIIRGRFAKTQGSNCALKSGGQQNDGYVELYQSTTLIAQGVLTSLTGSAWQTLTYTLTGTETDSITNYPALRLKGYYIEVGGGQARGTMFSAMEFECPDAPLATPPIRNASLNQAVNRASTY